MRPSPCSHADPKHAELFVALVHDRRDELFMLWRRKRRLCSCTEDFRRHDGNALQIEANIQRLQE